MTPLVEAEAFDNIEAFLSPHLKKFHNFRIYDHSNRIEVRGRPKEDDLAETLVVRVVFNHEAKQAYIPNIFMPEFMRHQRIGKELIAIIYRTVRSHGYNLFITDLTNSFYERLVKRGAVVCEEGETVLITDKTSLA